jgi:hypothetical protein
MRTRALRCLEGRGKKKAWLEMVVSDSGIDSATSANLALCMYYETVHGTWRTAAGGKMEQDRGVLRSTFSLITPSGRAFADWLEPGLPSIASHGKLR